MNLFALVLYIAVNAAMCFHFLYIRKDRGYEYPFWVGMIGLIFVMPQAVAFYDMPEELPENGFWYTLLFSTLCTVALWHGFSRAVASTKPPGRLLAMRFNLARIQWVATILVFVGIIFYLWFNATPKQTNEVGNLTGLATVLIFFAQLMKFGFCLSLYLFMKYKYKWSLFLTILSSSIFLIAIIAFGRRNDTAQFALAILLVCWFVKGWTVPRWSFVVMMIAGFIGINAIGSYRSVMVYGDGENQWETLKGIDWYDAAQQTFQDGGGREFANCVYNICAADQLPFFDLGSSHWNLLVFSYVPAQFIGGPGVKLGLCLPGSFPNPYPRSIAYPHYQGLNGSMMMGYSDAYQSFAWFGAFLFWLCGWMMGSFYRFGKAGNLLAAVLYLWLISQALHVVPAFTAVLLTLPWVFFFVLIYPLLCWASCPDENKEHDVK